MCILWSTKYYLCGHTRPNSSRSKLCPKRANCPCRKHIILQSNLQTCQDCWDAGDRRVNKSFAHMLIRHAEERRQRQQSKAERYFIREVLRRRHHLSDCISDHTVAREPERSLGEKADGEGRGANAADSSLGAQGAWDAEGRGGCQFQTGPRVEAESECETKCEAESGGIEIEKVEVELDESIGGEEYGCPSGTLRPETPSIHWRIVKRYQPRYDDLPRVCDPVELGSIRRNYRARRGRTWE